MAITQPSQGETIAARVNHVGSPRLGLTPRRAELLRFIEAYHRGAPSRAHHKGANSAEHVTTNGTGRMHMDQLPNFVEHAFRSSPPDQAIHAGPTSSRTSHALLRRYRESMKPRTPDFARLRAWHRRVRTKRLNPAFVEYLMGLPSGWTGSAPVETGSCLWWRDMRGLLSTLGSPPMQPKLL